MKSGIIQTKKGTIILFFMIVLSFCFTQAEVLAQKCAANFTVSGDTAGCATLVVTFIDKSTGALNWSWDFPGGNPSHASGQGPHTVKYYNAGSYDVQLAIAGYYCKDSIIRSDYIKVYDCNYCQADFSAKPTSGCEPLKVVFTDNSTDATDWKWSFPGGIPSSASTEGPHTVIYNSAGNYDVTLEIVCPNGKDKILKEDYITVEDCECQADFQGSPLSGCAPLEVKFKDNSTNAVSWNWAFPGGTPSSASTEGPHIVTYNSPGKYDVKLAIKCKNGDDTEVKNDYVVVEECECKASFKGDPLSGPAPLKVTFTDNSTNAVSWEWNFPGGDPASANGEGPHEVWYYNPGEYDVDLKIKCKTGDAYYKKTEYIKVTEQGESYDFGDAPEPYPTTLEKNGARHLVDERYKLGKLIDAEPDGLPDSLAQGDDTDGVDDEDGIAILHQFVRGQQGQVEVFTSASGMIKAWIDWNQDGDWDDESENVIDSQIKENGQVFNIPVPNNALIGDTYGRFRYDRDRIPDNSGLATVGEVEDMVIGVYLILPGEYGDAPEGVPAYPYLGVIGSFPTCKDAGPSGYIRHAALGQRYLGYRVDYEIEGNAGHCFGAGIRYDQDDLNPSTWVFGERTFRDEGLLNIDAYSIKEIGGTHHIWPGSVTMPNGIMGEPGETIYWGTNFDLEYHVDSEDGAWLNVFADWDQNGIWQSMVDFETGRVLNENPVQNFRILGPSEGKLSEIHPPGFDLGPNSGYVWMRFIISDSPIEDTYDGSGVFADGETEDYLLLISYDGLYDFGDAPDGGLAYPSTGVVGNFPTCAGTGSGHIQHDRESRSLRFGEFVDYEFGGNAGLCNDFVPLYYDQDEDFYDERRTEETRDGGLMYPVPNTIQGMTGAEFVGPMLREGTTDLPFSLGSAGNLATWGEDIDILYCRPSSVERAYFNMIFDWNQDGEWGGSVEIPGASFMLREHAIQNFELTEHTCNTLISETDISNIRLGPNSGYIWVRITITPEPVELPWDGSGEFDFGESEDYLLKVDAAPELPRGFDYGDLPGDFGNPLPGMYAVHRIQSGFWLGDTVDAEDAPQFDSRAEGDDNSGIDDEDGIRFFSALNPGKWDSVLVQPSTNGVLNGWLDFNGNKSWADEDDHFIKNVSMQGGQQLLFFQVPETAQPGRTFARFRFSDVQDLSYEGPNHSDDQMQNVPVGEVEDYMVTITPEVTSISDEDVKPTEFKLLQNYPNPFNPETTIEYRVKTAGRVVLKVFDTLGKEIATIVDSHQEAGVYHIKLDARDLPSGVYFYQFHCGDFSAVKKFMLMK